MLTVKQKFKNLLESQIANDVAIRQDLTLVQIAKMFGVAVGRVSKIARERGISRPRGAGSPAWQKHKWVSRPEEL